MRNNTRGLFIHLIVVVFMFGIATLINLNQTLLKIFYGNLIFKIIISIIPLILYYNFGKGLSKKASSKLDFFSGNIIVLLFLILAIISLIGMHSKEGFEVAGNLWRLPMDLFMFPFVYPMEVLGIDSNYLFLFISSLIPTIVFGISIKRERVKINKRRKMMEMRKRKNER